MFILSLSLMMPWLLRDVVTRAIDLYRLILGLIEGVILVKLNRLIMIIH